MKHKFLSFFTLVLLFGLAILQSCVVPEEDEKQNCANSPPAYYTLSAPQKSILPYKGYDTISMVSNTGDTIHCIGTGKQYFNTKVFVPHSHPSCAGYGTEKFYEAYVIRFVDSLRNEEIQIMHYYYHTYNEKIRYNDVGIIYKSGGWFITDSHISNPNVQNYFGDIVIDNTTHKNVNKVKNYNSLDDPHSFVMINKKNGILKIQLNETESWGLIKN